MRNEPETEKFQSDIWIQVLLSTIIPFLKLGQSVLVLGTHRSRQVAKCGRRVEVQFGRHIISNDEREHRVLKEKKMSM